MARTTREAEEVAVIKNDVGWIKSSMSDLGIKVNEVLAKIGTHVEWSNKKTEEFEGRIKRLEEKDMARDRSIDRKITIWAIIISTIISVIGIVVGFLSRGI